jgi:CRISPR/Cas system type I-B associated protein Csh2 (Cas7 group RAMP superfamily)
LDVFVLEKDICSKVLDVRRYACVLSTTKCSMVLCVFDGL